MKHIFFLLLVFSFSLLSAELPKPNFHWDFDHPVEKGNLIPATVGPLKAKLLQAEAIRWVEARQGRAVDLGNRMTPSGTPCPGIVIPGLTTDFTKPFTIVTTLKLDPVAAEKSGYKAFKDIWGNTGTRGPGVRLSIFYGMFIFNSGDGKKAASVTTKAAETPVPIGKWFQIACVYDGTTVTLYCDGKQVASKELTITPGKGIFHIGESSGNAYPLPGMVDDFKIFHRALDADEIARLALDFAE